MYAVIFRAEIAELDDEYSRIAERLRELALNRYGCSEFVSLSEGSREIAISYWQSETQIAAWKQDVEHLAAQKLGRSRWYASFRVEVVEIKRAYGSDG